MPEFKQSTVNSQQLTVRKVSPDALIPTSQIVKLAKIGGVDFGPGNPLERIRYFIKLGLLPHAVRKLPQTTNGKQLKANSYSTMGHLPYWTVKRLVQIDKLYKRGLSYPQIAQKIKDSPREA